MIISFPDEFIHNEFEIIGPLYVVYEIDLKINEGSILFFQVVRCQDTRVNSFDMVSIHSCVFVSIRT